MIERREESIHQWGLDEEVGTFTEFLKEEEDWNGVWKKKRGYTGDL